MARFSNGTGMALRARRLVSAGAMVALSALLVITPLPGVSPSLASASQATQAQSIAPQASAWASTATQDQKDKVLEQAAAAKMAGLDALTAYVDGKDVSDEGILGIDVDVLADIQPALATEITELQAAINAAAQPPATDSSSSSSSATDSSSGDTGAADGTTADIGDASEEDSSASSSSSSSSPSSSSSSSSSSAAEESKPNPEIVESHPDPALDKYFSKTDGDGEAETGPFIFSPNPTTDEFVASIALQARDIGQESDLYASVMIAQAILESGSGSSQLSKAPHFNLFGIKGTYNGAGVNMKTSEDDGTGKLESITAQFRSYPSARESLADYAGLLTGTMGSFYAPVRKSATQSFSDACDYLQGHYATDTSYSGKLKAIIEAYGLTVYDNLEGSVVEAEAAVQQASLVGAAHPASYSSYSMLPVTYSTYRSALQSAQQAAILICEILIGLFIAALLGSKAFSLHARRMNGADPGREDDAS